MEPTDTPPTATRVEAPLPEVLGRVQSAIVAEDRIFRASRDQHLIRARLWLELRDNPGLHVDELTQDQIAQIVRDRRVLGWMKKSRDFRKWLKSPRDTEERIEAAYAQFVEGLELRMVGMSDKDYINCVKLLAELANKMPKKWENTKILDADVGKMSDEDRLRLMVDTLRRMGYEISEPAQLAIDAPGRTTYEGGAGAAPDSASLGSSGTTASEPPHHFPIPER